MLWQFFSLSLDFIWLTLPLSPPLIERRQRRQHRQRGHERRHFERRLDILFSKKTTVCATHRWCLACHHLAMGRGQL